MWGSDSVTSWRYLLSAPRSRRIFTFHRPETLAEWTAEPDTLRYRLAQMPFAHRLATSGMRDCQVEAITGLEQSFAANLEISPSMWSQIKSSRPIGDKLARQIEQHCGKAAGWLDEEREAEGLSPAEQQFLALALKAWRASNSEGRKKLRTSLKALAEGPQ